MYVQSNSAITETIGALIRIVLLINKAIARETHWNEDAKSNHYGTLLEKPESFDMLLTHIETAECRVKSVPYCGSSLVKLSCHQNFLCFCRPLQRRNTPYLTSLLKLQDMPFDWLSASSFIQGHPVKLNVPYFRPCQFHKFNSCLGHQSQIKMVKYSLFKHFFLKVFTMCRSRLLGYFYQENYFFKLLTRDAFVSRQELEKLYHNLLI